MLTAGRVLSVAKKGAGSTMRTAIIIITLASTVVALVGFIVKAIWFKVEYGHVAVMMRNEKLKLTTDGKPVIKESGWRAQFPIRDDKRSVDCTLRTSELKPQDLEADGKNTITATADWHVLSLRDRKKFRYHPARTLLVQDLTQTVEEILRDAVRTCLAKSETPASQWESEDLYKEVRSRVEKRLNKIGVGLDDVRIPDAARSEAETHGRLVKEGFRLISGQPIEEDPSGETEETYPHAVPS